MVSVPIITPSKAPFFFCANKWKTEAGRMKLHPTAKFASSPTKAVVVPVKRRFNKIYICLDNDEAGLKDGVHLANKTGFINVVIPQFKGGKDISDLYKVLGNKEQFKQTILSLFK